MLSVKRYACLHHGREEGNGPFGNTFPGNSPIPSDTLDLAQPMKVEMEIQPHSFPHPPPPSPYKATEL